MKPNGRPPPVLFLDLDGTLHPNGTVHLLPNGEIDSTGAFVWAAPLLKLLAAFPRVAVVLHSTWRLVWEQDKDLLYLLPPELAGRVVGCTPRSVMGRYQSIEAYRFTKDIKEFAILDDEPAAYPAGLAELVVADPEHGISPESVQAALTRAFSNFSPDFEEIETDLVEKSHSRKL